MHRIPHRARHPAFVDRQEGGTFLQHTCVEVGGGGGAVDHPDGFQIKVHLFGDKGCQRRLDTLPHLGPRGDKRHAIAVDQHIGVQRRTHPFQRVGIGRLVPPPAKGHSGPNGGCAEKKGPAGNFPDPCHVKSPALRRGWPRGCADRCRSGTGCPPSPRRSRHRSGLALSQARLPPA